MSDNTANMLASTTVLVSLNISRWGARRFDRSVTEEVHRKHATSNDVGRYNKRLIDTKEMSDITTIIDQARSYHYRVTLPWLDNGSRVLPSSLFFEYADRMRDLRRAYNEAVEAFVAKYPRLVDEARVRLKSMFDSRDYPDPRAIAGHFDFDYGILPMPETAPEDFRIALSGDQVEEVRRDVERRMEGVVRKAQTDILDRIVQTIGHMSERLGAYKPKRGAKRAEGVFHASLVENVRDLVAILPAFNLDNDPTFTKLIERMEANLCGADAEVLRMNPKVRRETKAAADAILAAAQDYLG